MIFKLNRLNPKNISGATVVFFTLALSGPAAGETQAPGGALDLWQCYEKAIQQSETVAISEEGIRQAEEQYRQAWSGIPPRLSFRWQEFYQDPSHNKLRQAQGGVNLRLPVLTGYREMAAMNSAKTLTRQKELETKRARQLILSDVAQAFWNVVETENQIQVTKSQQALRQDRIKELEDRVRIGRFREAEVVAAQSQLAQLEANQEDLERVRVAARELLAFLTGTGRDIPLADAIPPALALGPGAEIRIPMAIAVIGGVFVSTLLTLFVVPCAMTILSRFESKRHWDELRQVLKEIGQDK